MRRLLAVTLVILLPSVLLAETIRGPVIGRLEADPSGDPLQTSLTLDEIVLLGTTGDQRFFDAVEIEITVPPAATEIPGALSVILLTTGTITEHAGVSEINGQIVHSGPLVRPGRLIFQIPLRPDAPIHASAAVSIIEQVLTAEDLPLAITIQTFMKGASPSIASAELPLVFRAVPRNIGALQVHYTSEDGTVFQADSYLAPEFDLMIDDQSVVVGSEYLLAPGIHQIELLSETYQDQSFTVGIEQAQVTALDVPLLPALATVSYVAPRGARVYLDGRSLDSASGDFTAVPGEHTIVVVVGDYTITRRFSVEEGAEYDLSVTMDVTIEEAK